MLVRGCGGGRGVARLASGGCAREGELWVADVFCLSVASPTGQWAESGAYLVVDSR